jgi:hypothetical protein
MQLFAPLRDQPAALVCTSYCSIAFAIAACPSGA